VTQALSAGIAGIAFGRNIWSHADPRSITTRLVEIIHGPLVSLSRATNMLVAAG
jgi:DhnA family fructose-bisphosphate aldolase class Ia